MQIHVHNLDSEWSVTESKIILLVKHVVSKIAIDLLSCQIIFVDDETLRNMHEKYLNEPDYTDVMTFDVGEDKTEGEIYISRDRIKENAENFNVSLDNEIYRIIIHGILHLKGYRDKSDVDKKAMQQMEDKLLNDINTLQL